MSILLTRYPSGGCSPTAVGNSEKLPLLAAVIICVIGPTAGRYFIDNHLGPDTPAFCPGEWFVGTAVPSIQYIIFSRSGLAIWPATLLTFVIAFAFRLAALTFRWEEPEPPEAVVKG